VARRAGGHLARARLPVLGLYIHVPFCSSICHYCNFNRGLFDDGLKQRYVAAAIREIREAPRRFGWLPGQARADTIFFGGGTPSLLDSAEIGALVGACRDAFGVSADAEVTMEANPETVSEASLGAVRLAGVNRISFGVQSFRQEELQRLGRIHDVPRARKAVADARAAGFENLSLDLMMWLPEQTVPAWLESVAGAIDLAPEHLSLYMLELYPNAPLREAMARAGWSQAPDDDAAEMYEAAMERLERAGYQQYEISNVARPGLESRHNLKYWQDGEWIGFGPGAHSTLGGTRWKNVSGTEDYVARVGAGVPHDVEHRTLTPEQRWQEAVITGLRLSEGLDLGSVREKYGLDILGRYGDHLAPYLGEGLLLHQQGRLRLSRRGMLVANEVLVVFI
jgi:oxygen-independent coproporphyrinogen-3 oxidase